MFQEFYARSEHLIWPLVGLIIFVVIFVGVLAFTFLGLRDRKKIDEIAAMPLDDTSTPDHTDGTDGRAV